MVLSSSEKENNPNSVEHYGGKSCLKEIYQGL